MEDKELITHEPSIVPAKPFQVQIIEHGRDIHMYRMTDVELDALIGGYSSVNLGFFTLCLGALLVFAITLATVDLTDRKLAVFVAVTVLLSIATLFFGIKAWADRRHMNQRVKEIKSRRQVP